MIDLLDNPLPEEINNAAEEKNKKDLQKGVYLFFSFDIVNSTKFKTVTDNWLYIIKELLETIQRSVSRSTYLENSSLWRIIGDELVYLKPILKLNELYDSVNSIFDVTQHIDFLLENGKFYESIGDQSFSKNNIEMLKSHNLLSIRSAAWIAVLNDKIESPYDNIYFNYNASSSNQFREFLGKDIDTGFRLKEFTQARRLIVSVELAFFLNCNQTNNLYIIDYTKLKGVWNDGLYPIIWFYNEHIVEKYFKEFFSTKDSIPFEESFKYDEFDNNEIVKNYLLRFYKKNTANYSLLSKDMYKVDTAITKIIQDRNLSRKIEYIKSNSNKDLTFFRNDFIGVLPLELHCAVVCCYKPDRTVLITKRESDLSTNPKKWEFGCAKVISGRKIVETITEYYEKSFGLKIELIKDSNRSEKLPKPIAIYEIENNLNKKGIIFLANVMNKNEKFRPDKKHVEVKWISEKDINSFKEETVPDFHNTLKYVFDNFNNFFGD